MKTSVRSINVKTLRDHVTHFAVKGLNFYYLTVIKRFTQNVYIQTYFFYKKKLFMVLWLEILQEILFSILELYL